MERFGQCAEEQPPRSILLHLAWMSRPILFQLAWISSYLVLLLEPDWISSWIVRLLQTLPICPRVLLRLGVPLRLSPSSPSSVPESWPACSKASLYAFVRLSSSLTFCLACFFLGFGRISPQLHFELDAILIISRLSAWPFLSMFDDRATVSRRLRIRRGIVSSMFDDRATTVSSRRLRIRRGVIVGGCAVAFFARIGPLLNMLCRRVKGLITVTTVALEFCTQPNLTESLVLETSETSYTFTLPSNAYELMQSHALSI